MYNKTVLYRSIITQPGLHEAGYAFSWPAACRTDKLVTSEFLMSLRIHYDVKAQVTLRNPVARGSSGMEIMECWTPSIKKTFHLNLSPRVQSPCSTLFSFYR